MRRVHFLFAVAAICALAVVALLLRNFSTRPDSHLPTTKGASLQAPPVPFPASTVSPGTAARELPLPLVWPARAASAAGQGKTKTQADAAHDQFARWAEQYLSASITGGKAALLAQGKELATARREALAALIETNPKRALELAAPYKWHEELPAEIAALLERRVSGRGNYSVFGAVPLEGQKEFVGPILRYVTIESNSYRAFVYGRRQHQISQSELALHGIAINDALALHEDPLRVLEPEEARAILGRALPGRDPVCSISGLPTTVIGQATVVAYGDQIFQLCRMSHAAELNRRLILAEGGLSTESGGARTNLPPVSPEWTHGPKRVLFMRVNFPDDPTEPITESEAMALMNQVNEFYLESSFNKTTLVPTVTPLLTLPQAKLYYSLKGPGELMLDARQKAKEAGYPPQNYDLDIVRHVTVPGFNFGGLGA